VYYKREKGFQFFCKNTLPVLWGYCVKNLTWNDILSIPHNHRIKIKKISGSYVEIFKHISASLSISDDSFCQLRGGILGKHRIIGYRKDGVFHVLFEDKEHEVYPHN
jgi:hypothetical protein